MRKMLLVFSHRLTGLQIQSAKDSLKVEDFMYLPEDLQHLWSNIPPEAEDINNYIKEIVNWIDKIGKKNDFILVQGDFGATYGVVNHCILKGLTAIYSTTKREAKEIKNIDGTISLTHKVDHVTFRQYQK